MIENDREKQQKKILKIYFLTEFRHFRSFPGLCRYPCAPKISTKLNILHWILLFCSTKEIYHLKKWRK